MHYQVVVLDSETDGAMQITSLAWQRAPTGDDQGHYYDVEIHMGLCANDALGSTFEDNWVPGTKTLVYSGSVLDLSAAANEWEPVTLTTPYWYGGQQNLLIDIQWASANTSYSFYTWKWDTGAARSVKAGDLSSATGVLSTQMSELMLTGTLELDGSTFAGVKTAFEEGF